MGQGNGITEPPVGSKYALDPANPFEAALTEMVHISRRKRNDYAEDGDPFSNFRRSADQVRQPTIVSVEVLIATKQARLRELLFTGGKAPANESILDTLLDRAVYSVIAYCVWKEQQDIIAAKSVHGGVSHHIDDTDLDGHGIRGALGG